MIHSMRASDGTSINTGVWFCDIYDLAIIFSMMCRSKAMSTARGNESSDSSSWRIP
jgi:hypothetical protein